jgi:hypothetical protein
MKNGISLIMLTLALISCREMLNEIPEHCYPESYAISWYDSIRQNIPESIDPLTGINENYLFGADPFGGWSYDITTDSFTVLFSSQERFITESDYTSLSHEDWKKRIERDGQYAITSSRMTRTEVWLWRESGTVFLGSEFHNNLPTAGEVRMSTFKEGDCYFIRVNFWADLPENENKTHRIQGELAVPYGPINL